VPVKHLNIIKHKASFGLILWYFQLKTKKERHVVFTYKTIVIAFSKALEVISVPLAPAIGEPLTSSRAYVVEVPNEISSTWSCLLRQVTGCC